MTHLNAYADVGLNTDLYQLTMAQGYWADGRSGDEACFHMFFRSLPFRGGYAIAAGLGSFLEYLEKHFGFDEEDLDYLRSLDDADGSPLFDPEFLQFLAEMEFECDVSAIEEGTPVFPHEPLVRVKGPLIQAQLVETPLLNFLNYQTLVTTKTHRIVKAAEGRPVLEFGLRRAQGPDGGISAARASYIGGASGTSNVLAGKLMDIPVRGTHAHSWVQSYEDEIDAFRAFAESQPGNAVFLVDTYDTLEGVDKAIAVADELGLDTFGIRLDSGDLAWLSRRARELLDDAGYGDATIVASNSLDEEVVRSLRLQEDEIDVYGVGTNLVTCKGDPALGGVYKLAAVRQPGSEWRLTMKMSERKTKRSIPGLLDVIRYTKDGKPTGDMIRDVSESECAGFEDNVIVDPQDSDRFKECEGEGSSLMAAVVEGGEVVSRDSLSEARRRRERWMDVFHDGIKRLENPHEYPVGLSVGLHEKRKSLIAEHGGGTR